MLPPGSMKCLPLSALRWIAVPAGDDPLSDGRSSMPFFSRMTVSTGWWLQNGHMETNLITRQVLENARCK